MESLYKGKRAVILSVLVHALLLAWLLLSSDNQRLKNKDDQQVKSNKIKQQAIDSYIYKMPAPKLVEETLEPEIQQELKQEPKTAQKIQPEIKATITTEKVIKKRKNNEEKYKQAVNHLDEAVPLIKDSTVNSVVIKQASKEKASFSSYQQLDKLRATINKQILAQESAELQRFRSASTVHGEQVPVPHSALQLTPEQKQEKKTTRMSDAISITKYDNGLCTLERKQFLSSPIEGSYAAFTCGENKFDKSFREHMKKVQDRYSPVNR